MNHGIHTRSALMRAADGGLKRERRTRQLGVAARVVIALGVALLIAGTCVGVVAGLAHAVSAGFEPIVEALEAK